MYRRVCSGCTEKNKTLKFSFDFDPFFQRTETFKAILLVEQNSNWEIEDRRHWKGRRAINVSLT
jgi:hypothetical protein